MEYQTLKIESKEHYHICQLHNSTGNAINLKMIQELDHYITHFSETGKLGCILTGGGNIFSVGLDIKELITLDDSRVQVFFSSFFDLVLKLVKFPFPLIAAINGHSPAGGCVLALTSDYRVMAENEKLKIGLNELPVGVMATPSIFHLYSFWIGRKMAYQYLLSGRLMSPLEAKSTSLIDETVPQDEVIITAEKKMRQFLSYDPATWKGMKHNFRLALLHDMEADATNKHIKTYDHFIKNDGRGKLEKVLEALAKR